MSELVFGPKLLEALARRGMTNAEVIHEGTDTRGVHRCVLIVDDYDIIVRGSESGALTIVHGGTKPTIMPCDVTPGAVAQVIAAICVRNEKPFAMSDVVGRRLYLARYALNGNTPSKRHGLLVCAASEHTARQAARIHWKVVEHHVAIDEATEEERGRHNEVLLERGKLIPIEVFFTLWEKVR